MLEHCSRHQSNENNKSNVYNNCSKVFHNIITKQNLDMQANNHKLNTLKLMLNALKESQIATTKLENVRFEDVVVLFHYMEVLK